MERRLHPYGQSPQPETGTGYKAGETNPGGDSQPQLPVLRQRPPDTDHDGPDALHTHEQHNGNGEQSERHPGGRRPPKRLLEALGDRHNVFSALPGSIDAFDGGIDLLGGGTCRCRCGLADGCHCLRRCGVDRPSGSVQNLPVLLGELGRLFRVPCRRLLDLCLRRHQR